jgi:hypothetical protein
VNLSKGGLNVARIYSLLTASLVFLAVPLLAQSSAPPPQGCSSEAHRQFDFWIGEWEVSTPDGKVAGHNVIESILGGCVLAENWTSAGGGVEGKSFNVYDARTERWHQTWVDTSGSLLKLDGALDKGRMVLSGDGIARDGKPVRHEIAWTPSDDGSVEQHWRVQKEGEDWRDVFVGIYRKVKSNE